MNSQHDNTDNNNTQNKNPARKKKLNESKISKRDGIKSGEFALADVRNAAEVEKFTLYTLSYWLSPTSTSAKQVSCWRRETPPNIPQFNPNGKHAILTKCRKGNYIHLNWHTHTNFTYSRYAEATKPQVCCILFDEKKWMRKDDVNAVVAHHASKSVKRERATAKETYSLSK